MISVGPEGSIFEYRYFARGSRTTTSDPLRGIATLQSLGDALDDDLRSRLSKPEQFEVTGTSSSSPLNTCANGPKLASSDIAVRAYHALCRGDLMGTPRIADRLPPQAVLLQRARAPHQLTLCGAIAATMSTCSAAPPSSAPTIQGALPLLPRHRLLRRRYVGHLRNLRGQDLDQARRDLHPPFAPNTG
jgi:hypothetical protein